MTKGIVVIGASTGGPAALESLLPSFPNDFPDTVLVVQHLPANFIKTFRLRVSKKCQMDLIEAYDGLLIVPNTIYIVPGGINTEIESDGLGHIKIKTSTHINEIETPSIDKLMKSVANVYGPKIVAVILTGMGKDGTEGVRAIKEVGGKVLVQDEKSSVIYGMGKNVIEEGLADEIVPLSEMINRIIEVSWQNNERI